MLSGTEVVGDFSREMQGQLVTVSISGCQAAQFLEQLCESRGKLRKVYFDRRLATVSRLQAKRCAHGIA